MEKGKGKEGKGKDAKKKAHAATGPEDLRPLCHKAKCKDESCQNAKRHTKLASIAAAAVTSEARGSARVAHVHTSKTAYETDNHSTYEVTPTFNRWTPFDEDRTEIDDADEGADDA